MTRPPQPVGERRPMSRRLGMYMLGFAIGLVLVGFLLSVRRLMVTPPQGGGDPPAGAASPP